MSSLTNVSRTWSRADAQKAASARNQSEAGLEPQSPRLHQLINKRSSWLGRPTAQPSENNPADENEERSESPQSKPLVAPVTLTDCERLMTFEEFIAELDRLDSEHIPESPTGRDPLAAEKRDEEKKIEYQRRVTRMAPEILPNSAIEIVAAIDRFLRHPPPGAEVPATRILNLLRCAAGGWNTLNPDVHPETVVCTDFLTRLHPQERLSYLTVLYDTFGEYLAGQQQVLVKAAIDGINLAVGFEKPEPAVVNYAIKALLLDVEKLLKEMT